MAGRVLSSTFGLFRDFGNPAFKNFRGHTDKTSYLIIVWLGTCTMRELAPIARSLLPSTINSSLLLTPTILTIVSAVCASFSNRLPIACLCQLQHIFHAQMQQYSWSVAECPKFSYFTDSSISDSVSLTIICSNVCENMPATSYLAPNYNLTEGLPSSLLLAIFAA